MKPMLQTRIAVLLIFFAGFRILPAGAVESRERVEPVPLQVPTPVRVEIPAAPESLGIVRRALRYSPHAWSETETLDLARGIDETAAATGVSPASIAAMVMVESHFRPHAIHRNRNGTLDYGLSQQNSRYVFRRCRIVLGRACSPRELLEPDLSLRLMAHTLNTCGRVFRGEARIMCYNSWKHAYRFRRTGLRPVYLRRYHRELNRLTGIEL